MKIVLFESISKIIVIGVLAYAMGFAYENIWLIDTFDRGLSNGEIIDVDVKFSWWPLILSFLLILLQSFLSLKLKSRKRADILLKFGEFQDGDERERSITNKATRASHVAFTLSAMTAMLIMVLSTNYIFLHPAFPIYLFAGTIVTSSIAYAIAWCVEYYK